MPTPGWLRRQDLPIDAAGRSYIDPPNLDQILDQFVNWRGDVNGGGHSLSNVILGANVSGLQTPWLTDIDAAGHTLANVGVIAGSGPVTVASATVARFSAETSSPTGFAQLRIKADARIYQIAVAGSAAAGSLANCLYIYDESAAAERFRIDPSGKVIISNPSLSQVTSAITASTGFAQFRLQGDSRAYQLALGGSATGGGLAGAFYIFDESVGAARFLIDPSGVIKMFLGGTLKTLSVDGSGVVHAF